MNLRAKCVSTKCPAYGLEKSVAVGQMLGYGAKNDRVNCPACGELMQTTQSINVSTRNRTTKRTAKRTTKRVYKRRSGKRA
jgi:hypothetical protein